MGDRDRGATRRRSPEVRRSERLLATALLAAFAAYVGLVLAVGGDEATTSGTAATLINLPFVLAAIAAVRASRRGGSASRAWTVLGAALVAYLAGNLYARYHVPWGVFPSPADGLWLSSYGFAVVALVLLARATITGVTRAALLDGAVAGTTTTAAATTFVIGPLLSVGEDRFSVVVTNLAYPIADLLLLGLLVTTTKLVANVDRVRVLLALGVTSLFAGDAAFLWQTAHGTWIPAAIPMVLIVGSATLLGLAAVVARPMEPVAAAAPHLVVPWLGAATCIGLLAWGQSSRPGPAATILALMGVLLAGTRISMGVNDLRRSAALAEVCPTRLAQVQEVRHALRDRQIVAHFQPQVDLQTNQVIGAEVLARWLHPSRGMVGPDEFLPLLAEGQLMGRLTEAMLREAAVAREVCAGSGHPLSLSVNLSTPELTDPDLLATVADLAERTPAGLGAITLEITEESVIADPAQAHSVLTELRSHGVRISVDDYGTGHASLAYLRDLPLDEVKLDRSFVRGAWVDERSAAIAASTVELAHELHLSIVAEGIEDHETNAWLRSLGCDVGQGYFHARPMALEDLVPWLADRPVAG